MLAQFVTVSQFPDLQAKLLACSKYLIPYLAQNADVEIVAALYGSFVK